MNTNSYRSILSALALGALLLLGSHPSAQAQYKFFPNNATINSSTVIPVGPYGLVDTAVVGFKNYYDMASRSDGTNPTINVVAGASLGGGLDAYNHSVVNISGGTLLGVTTYDTSTVTITGGHIPGGVWVNDESTVNVYGGSIPGGLTTSNYCMVNVYGGSISGGLTAAYGGTVNVYGGSIGSSSNDAAVESGSTMNIYGGNFVSRQIYVDTIAIAQPAPDGSTLNVYGNLAHWEQVFYYFGNIRLVGFIWIPAHTVTAAVTGFVTSAGNTYTVYTLTGFLSDGTNVTGVKVFVEYDSGCSLNCVY